MRGFRIYATLPGTPHTIDDVDESSPIAVAFGNEHAGLTVIHQLDFGAVGALDVVLMDAEQTLEEFKAKAENEPKNPTEEKLADGWAMTSENNSATNKLYIVDARRKIDRKFYKCNAYVKTPEKAAEALADCKSLRK